MRRLQRQHRRQHADQLHGAQESRRAGGNPYLRNGPSAIEGRQDADEANPPRRRPAGWLASLGGSVLSHASTFVSIGQVPRWRFSARRQISISSFFCRPDVPSGGVFSGVVPARISCFPGTPATAFLSRAGHPPIYHRHAVPWVDNQYSTLPVAPVPATRESRNRKAAD